MIAEDDWTFAAVTIEPDKATFYVNGETGSVSEGTHEPALWNSNVYLGGDGTAGQVSRRMNGALDNVIMYDRALSAGEIRYLAGIRSGPVAQWALDDGAGAIAADSSGNGNDGVITGEPLWVTGIVGGALELDGVDDYVDCGNPAALDFGAGDFTISAWIQLTTAERATVYAKGGDNGGGIRYTLAMGEANDNKMTLTTDDDSDKMQTKGDTVVNDGEWHHVVGMREGNTGFVYVDGVLDGSLELPEGYDLSGSSQHNALIGAITDHRDPTGATLEKLFMGTIDEVAVYDRALSDAEVAALAGL